ncbi:hypothetical protein Dfri01_28780 [Dyadobacter frigoris]|nr:hypothetical protein Dfri01_28780 [Dyadobacter frigoris]
MKLAFYQIVVFTASISISLAAAPMKSGGISSRTVKSKTAVRPVTGKVTDGKGEAIPGSTVIVKGSETGTITDSDGKFSIEITNDAAILTISSIGYETKEVSVGSQSIFNIVLETSSAVLSEVVVTALGIQRDKKALTYATQQIGATNCDVPPTQTLLTPLTVRQQVLI